MKDPLSTSIAAIFLLFGTVVAFATPYLWRRGVMARLPASMRGSWPQTRAGSIMIGSGMLVEGVTFLFLAFFLSSPSLSILP